MVIGDIVEVKDCNKLGLNRDIVRGILIWRPMNRSQYTPQLYCIWLTGELTTGERQFQKRLIDSIHKKQLPNTDDWRDWQHYIWHHILNRSNKAHILYVPRELKKNITYLASEDHEISIGDQVLDRRWYSRFTSNPVRTVLAKKFDEAYEMDRLCIEDPVPTRYLSFGNWIYPILRRNVIKISGRKAPQAAEQPIIPKKSFIQTILTKVS